VLRNLVESRLQLEDDATCLLLICVKADESKLGIFIISVEFHLNGVYLLK